MNVTDTSRNNVTVVLVHGVGNPKLDELRDATIGPMSVAGIRVDDIHEFNWNAKVRKPFSDETTSLNSFGWTISHYIAAIGHGLLNAILIPFESSQGFWRSFLARCCECLSLALQTAPIVLLMLPLWFYRPTHLLVVRIVAMYLILSGITVALGLLSFSASILMQSIRVALIPFLWMFVFFLLVPANVSWPLLLGFLVFTFASFVAVHMPAWASPVDSSATSTGMDMATGGFSGFTLWAILYMFAGVSIWFTLLIQIVKLIKAVFSGPMKILADVSLYLGDEQYRRALIETLISDLEALGGDGKELILVTHSLGTVIAVDSLRESPRLCFSRITLITAGSPLTRMFHRFFPSRYPAARQLLSEFSQSFAQFRWINVYRPFDPIGTSLGLPGRCEVSTRQWRKLLMSAHSNYWSDSIAYTLVTPLITCADVSIENTGPVAISQPQFSLRFSGVVPGFRWAALITAMSILIGLFFWAFGASIYEASLIGPDRRPIINDTQGGHWLGLLGDIFFTLFYIPAFIIIVFLFLVLRASPPVTFLFSLFGLDLPWKYPSFTDKNE
jgi:hypothetical protein